MHKSLDKPILGSYNDLMKIVLLDTPCRENMEMLVRMYIEANEKCHIPIVFQGYEQEPRTAPSLELALKDLAKHEMPQIPRFDLRPKRGKRKRGKTWRQG